MLKDFLSQSHLLKKNLVCAKHLIREYKTGKWNSFKLKYDAEKNGCPISVSNKGASITPITRKCTNP